MTDTASAPVPDELAEQLTQAVGRTYRRFRAERASGQLGDAAMAVLGHLDRYGSATLTELSEHERVTPGSMSQTVNRLAELGYIARGADPGDGRRVLFHVTEDGSRIAREARARRYAWFNDRLAERTDEERQALAIAASVLQEIANS